MKAIPSYLAAVCLFAAVDVSAQAPEPNERVVKAEAAIVAGNAVSAKKRAISDALRQAVERAFAETLKESEALPQPWPAGVVQLKASLGNAAQKFVRSYRLIEHTTEGGLLKVMVEADVDTVLLRREFDRARGAGVAAAPGQAAKAANVLLVGGTASAAPTVARALTAAGIAAQLGRFATEAQLIADAGKQNLHGLFVAEAHSDEGQVRGSVQVGVKCRLASHLFVAGAPPGRAVLDQVDEERGFGADSAAARAACVERTSALLVRAVVAKLRAPVLGTSFVTLQLDILDPGAVSAVLQACKRMGAVIATEARQVSAKAAEIRVFTRMAGPALQQALGRELAGKLAITPIQTSNDVLALRVRNPDSSSIE